MELFPAMVGELVGFPITFIGYLIEFVVPQEFVADTEIVSN